MLSDMKNTSDRAQVDDPSSDQPQSGKAVTAVGSLPQEQHGSSQSDQGRGLQQQHQFPSGQQQFAQPQPDDHQHHYDENVGKQSHYTPGGTAAGIYISPITQRLSHPAAALPHGDG